jgi:hypothetical protein
MEPIAMNDMLRKAVEVADEVLFPAAAEVDSSGRIPDGHFDRLAEDGFYGLVAPVDLGGPGVEFEDLLQIVETLAGGCLATTFTWLQHHGVVMGLAMTSNSALRDEYLGRAVRGELRGGAAFSGAIQTPPRIRATRSGDGWTLNGQIPFVSGWGLVDMLHVSAVDEDDNVISCLVDAATGDGITGVHPLTLAAAQATNTVRLELCDFRVPDSRVTTCAKRGEFLAGMALSLRIDSSLPLGLTERAATLAEAAGQGDTANSMRAEARALRAKFDAAMSDPASLPALRAASSELAVRASASCVVAAGSSALLSTHTAQRLARESLFTLVVASRPAVKSELLRLMNDQTHMLAHVLQGDT